jgi:hypothetical protein
MARIEKKTGDKVYSIDYPQFNANHQYMATVFDIMHGLVEVAKDMTSYNDVRYETLTLMLLNFGLNEDVQQGLLDEREQLIKDKTNGVTDTDDRNYIIHNVNIAMAGKWLKTLNRYMTFEEKLEIMRVGPKDGK